MSENCENLVNCSFFNVYNGNSEVVKNGWVRIFCNDKNKSVNCHRKQLKKKTGSPPPPNMAPTGKML
jgi:hypothetical protein